nr:immunoglobulin heavy chain junction region [Mus musculus]MBK4195868.1 immunoglobulin heavy chain junction region [Mus musculus]MBK4195869.1 immunoglobulin heavy chain junction region [Mus musculus]
CARGVLFAYW